MIHDLPPGLNYIPPRTAIVQRIDVTGTSYCYGSRTATGTVPHPGTVAVDPRFIPLGSFLLIGGHFYVARDTGGDVLGARVDFWSDSCSLSWQFGRQRHIMANLLGGIIVATHVHRPIRLRDPHRRPDPDYAPLVKGVKAISIVLAIIALFIGVIVKATADGVER